jgi:PAS domain S-box-containing protein
MPPHSRRSVVMKQAHLLPFVLVALSGAVTLLGWWTGQVAWVQPRSYDLPLPASAAACLLFLGTAPCLLPWRLNRMTQTLALMVAAFGGLMFVEGLCDADFGLDNMLVRHQALVEGVRVGRVPTVLGFVLGASGTLLAWFASGRTHPRRPILLALAGSLTGAYGFTALLAGRLRLDQVDFWLHHAHIGPPAALVLLMLAGALIGLAARDPAAVDSPTGPSWLWLPVTVAGTTVTLLFWVSLREREIAYTNNTTQLAINNLATLVSGEMETHLESLTRMATRWTEADGTPQTLWEKDAASLCASSPAYRFIAWVDASLHTRWLWPHAGNEDVISFDHASEPARNRAIQRARESLGTDVAAPLISPVQEPSLAIYAAVQRHGSFNGFIVGELGYRPMLELIDRRLNLTSRYQLEVTVAGAPAAGERGPADIPVYWPGARDMRSSPRLTQAATFNLFGQRLTFRMTPRTTLTGATRQYLPEVALASGLGFSLLLGLVVNLAQAAVTRQRAAERNAAQLRAENEERRRVEARLKLTDERLNLALDATQVGVYEWEVLTGRVIYSPSVWTSLGYDPAQMPATFQIWTDLMHPDDVAGFKGALDAHFQGETTFIEPEYRMKHQNGDWHWFSARAKCVAWDTANKPLRVTGTCQNITDRRRAEEALRASQAAARLLTHVARRTGNIVFITTPAGNLQWTNESFTRLTGYPANEVEGCYLLDLLASPDNAPTALDQITQALIRVEPHTTDVIVRSKLNDQSYHIRLELQPVKNERGEAENFIVIGTDITTSVQTETALRRAKAEADAASRAKSEFLATMSHEIRTPMNGVIGMTSLLLETELDPEQRDYVNTIRTSGNALLAVINEILDFSKIESGRMEIEHQPFELPQCIEEALDIFALQAAAKNIELAYFVDPAVPPWILLDVTRVRQVLVNLLNNAVKFTVQGSITVEVRLAMVPNPDRALPPVAHRENGKYMIDFFVRDTGIGIPPDRRHLLFKPFSQVDSSTTRKYGGTGLGLAICDRLCQLMGGTIDVENNPGGGSVFHFSILAAPVESPIETGYAPLPAPLQGGLVLVVDDFPLNRILLRHALARLGLKSAEAAHLYDGTDIALKQPIIAAIIDNELLGETGVTLAEELRSRHAAMPVVLLTNPVEAANRIDSSDPHLIRLPKPIKPALLLELLHRQLVGSVPPMTAGRPGADPLPAPPTVVPPLAEAIPLEILLVEDNPVNQKVALRLLERLGYNADAVGNGVEALSALDQRKYDLVLMDLQMPEMDGLTAAREIRARYPEHRQPRIVALTANAVQGDRERCLDAGMDGYLSKPVKLEQIQKIILEYFRSGKSG